MEGINVKLRELMKKKELIEKDIKSLSEILVSQKNVGMTESLLDEENFPRNDIDIYGVRNARREILCLNYDHKSVMQEIELCLHELHGYALSNKKSEQEMEINDVFTCQNEPFAMIGRVTSSSPADKGGLKAGDQIIEFGSVNKNNFSVLDDVARITRYNKGRSMTLLVKRDSKLLQLSLVPDTWLGPGLLGCSIIPIPK